MEKNNKITTVIQLFLLIFLGSFFSVNYAFAVIGVCANCHVMHAQEANLTPGTTTYGLAGAGGTGGNSMLLEAGTCLGCHGSAGSGASGAPVVDHASDPSAAGQLAGGDFYWVASGDRYVHNVTELSDVDDIWNNVDPPGWDASNFDEHDGGVGGVAGVADWAANHLSCAGAYGCHGNHVGSAAGKTDMQAMNGAHHKNVATEAWRSGGTVGSSTATDIGNSYRFLLGIKGLEDAAYEEVSVVANTDLAHNIHYGESRTVETAPTTGTARSTISYFCGQCHGAFHSGDTGTGLVSNATFESSGSGTANTWVRHPVDFAMVNAGEYASYGTYVLSAPVGSSDTTNTTMGDGNEDRIVTCLSCHFAHGSQYEHLLRFNDDIATMAVGSGGTTGCLACHSDKRT